MLNISVITGAHKREDALSRFHKKPCLNYLVEAMSFNFL